MTALSLNLIRVSERKTTTKFLFVFPVLLALGAYPEKKACDCVNMNNKSIFLSNIFVCSFILIATDEPQKSYLAQCLRPGSYDFVRCLDHTQKKYNFGQT